jgi:UDP-glucuronate 4-epimerase
MPQNLVGDPGVVGRELSMGEPVLVTGCAGFIGYHMALRLLDGGRRVVGLDNLSPYYDGGLKRARLARLAGHPAFTFAQFDLMEGDGLDRLFREHAFGPVVHLAAQAGVRSSLDDPRAYVDANLTGFANLLEVCRRHGCRHLLFASSSSVYGANTRVPFRASDNTDHPVNLYAASKKANEGMAHSYAHLFGVPMTGMRFFTVYGPWGRPDMAMSLFADAIMSGRPLRLFDGGRLQRDYTFIDDVTEAILRLIELPPVGDPGWSGDAPDPAASAAPWRILNIGSGRPIEIRALVGLLEEALGRKAEAVDAPMQRGDMRVTYADIEPLAALTGFRPATPLKEGIARFADWYLGQRAIV